VGLVITNGISTAFGMKIETIFSNFIAYENLSLDNKSLENFCYDMKEKDPEGRVLSNKGGWQSRGYLYKESKNYKILKLGSIIQCKMEILRSKFGFVKNTQVKELKIGNFWININKINDSNSPHIHASSIFSCVYYVKVPEKSGNITFLNSSSNFLEKCFNHKQVIKYNEFNSSTYTYAPKEGDLLMFPSWLLHQVENSESMEDRITIAFNCLYVKD
jgi:uncharacterized protein (TIGR02466 family)